jgi:hypothetical protein
MANIVELPFPLLADIAEGRCIPFIGASFSRNAIVSEGTMPDWPGSASQLASEGGLDATLPGPQVAQEYEHRMGVCSFTKRRPSPTTRPTLPPLMAVR